MALVLTDKANIVFPAHIPQAVIDALALQVYKTDQAVPYSTLSGSYTGANFEIIVDANNVLIYNDLDYVFHANDFSAFDAGNTFQVMYPSGTDVNGLIGTNISLYRVGDVYLYLTRGYYSVYDFQALTPVSIGGDTGNAYRRVCVVDPTVLY